MTYISAWTIFLTTVALALAALFGVVSEAVWLAVIGIVGLTLQSGITILTMIVKEHLDRRRAVDAANLADHVRSTLKKNTEDQVARLDEVAAKVEEVHKATNSLTDRLVETTGAKEFARGGAEERARQGKEGGG